MDKNLYIDSMEYYICKECKSVKRIEVRRFIKDIEELYNEYLHKIIEDNSSVYALFQLITISHREIITKILENENNIKDILIHWRIRKLVLAMRILSYFIKYVKENMVLLGLQVYRGQKEKRNKN